MTDGSRYPKDTYILLGKVTKAHGMQGELKVICYSGEPENLRHYRELIFINSNGKRSIPFPLKATRKQGKYAIVRIAEVNNRDEAERFEGLEVLLDKNQLPSLEKDEYYWHNLEGTLIQDTARKELGVVETVFNNGAQDVLIVKGKSGEFFIPVTKEIVIGEEEGALIVDPPPGLLHLNVEKNE